MNKKDHNLRMQAGHWMCSITPVHLRRHLMSALADTTINGYPSMFRCMIQDGKIAFILDPGPEIQLDCDTAKLTEFYRTEEVSPRRDKAAAITITLQDVGEEVKISVNCNDKEGFLKKNEHGEMVPVSAAAAVACGMIAHVKNAIGKSNE